MMRQRTLAAMVVFLLLGAALRFYRLDEQSFWNDEGNSARLSERSISLIIEGTASDVHPPLYYLILHGWRELVGDSEFALRSLSAFMGIGLLGLTFALGRQLLGPLGRTAAIAGASFAAVNPALVYYSQEARMYELLAFLATLSTLILVRLLHRPGWSLRLVIAYILTTTAGLYTHYFFPAVLLVQNLIFLIWLFRRNRGDWETRRKGDAETRGQRDGETVGNGENGISGWGQALPGEGALSTGLLRDLGYWVLIMLGVFALYLPWVQVFARQVDGRSGSRIPPLPFIVESGKWMAYGPTIELAEVVIPLIVYGILFLLGIFSGRKSFRGGISFSITLTFGVVIPILIMWVTGAIRPAFFKFMLVSVPPLCLLAGSGTVWIWNSSASRNIKQIQRLIVVILVALVFWGTARSLYNLYFNPSYARADYRAMAKKIAEEGHPNAAVILNAANQWEVFTYYHEDGVHVFPVPAGYPDPSEIDAELSDITGRYDRLYAIFWGEAERDPSRLVQRWLDDHTFKARDEWFSDVRFVTYAVPSEATGEIDTPTDLSFGDTITLLGYSLQSDISYPGDILQLALFWQAGERLDKRYKVFLHLIDESGQIVAQQDSEPDGDLAPTTIWEPGQIVMDNHGLFIPAETRPGSYTLVLGLYDIADPTDRLPIDEGNRNLDAWPVAEVKVIGE